MSVLTHAGAALVLNLRDNRVLKWPSVLKPFFHRFFGAGQRSDPHQSRKSQASVNLPPDPPPFSSIVTPYSFRPALWSAGLRSVQGPGAEGICGVVTWGLAYCGTSAGSLCRDMPIMKTLREQRPVAEDAKNARRTGSHGRGLELPESLPHGADVMGRALEACSRGLTFPGAASPP